MVVAGMVDLSPGSLPTIEYKVTAHQVTPPSPLHHHHHTSIPSTTLHHTSIPPTTHSTNLNIDRSIEAQSTDLSSLPHLDIGTTITSTTSTTSTTITTPTCVVSLQLGGEGGVVLPSPSLKSHSTEPPPYWPGPACLGAPSRPSYGRFRADLDRLQTSGAGGG